jgi:hypothetical protein
MTAKFLTKQQKQYVIARLQVETGSGRGRVTNEEPIRMHYIIAALKEWKIWLAVLVWWGNSVTIYGYVSANHSKIVSLTTSSFTYTVPTVITQLGFSNADAVSIH